MKKRYKLIAGAVLTLAVMTAQANLVHDYELNNSLADQLGGPGLVSVGGSLNPTNYSFGTNQGLSLSGAFSDPGTYSIEMKFNFAVLDSWRKIVDFKNLGTDEGLYDYSSALQFVRFSGGNFENGPNGAFIANQDVNLILTRNSATQQVIGYLGGAQQIAFTDTTNLAIFSGTGGIVNFFIDDVVTGGGEASAGVVDYIRLYDKPLTAPQAACLNTGTPGSCGLSNIPEPATLALMMLGFSGLGLVSLRRMR